MRSIIDRDLNFIIQKTQGKKVILYGIGDTTKEIMCKLECLDIKVSYCVYSNNADAKSVTCDVYNVLSILEEEVPFYVIICEGNESLVSSELEELGLSYLDDYCLWFSAAGCVVTQREFPLDVNLGYSMAYKKGVTTNGLIIYGDINSASTIVAVLGGSTSDGTVYKWKCWSEFFYEKCIKSEMSVALINAAVAGYSSSEELLKFYRDVMQYQPNIVISYGGINDRNSIQPYANSYQNKLFNVLRKKIVNQAYSNNPVNRVNFGYLNEMYGGAKKWIQNQRLMHAMANEYGIRHIAIYQPNLISKKRGSMDEIIYYYIQESEIDNRKIIEDSFEEYSREIDYVIDARRWLDNYDGLFLDYCHLSEEGNRILADCIYKLIFNKGE